MSNGEQLLWSPAREPYAIAVSHSWWALQSARLFAADAKKSQGHAQQIYARQLFGHLRVLRRAAEMMAEELRRRDINEADRNRFEAEIETFDVAIPCVKDARDIIEHFDEYARGEGKLERQAIQDLAIDVFEAAAMFWGGGYDPSTEMLTEGPFQILVPDGITAAERLQAGIHTAGRAIDRARAAPP